MDSGRSRWPLSCRPPSCSGSWGELQRAAWRSTTRRRAPRVTNSCARLVTPVWPWAAPAATPLAMRPRRSDCSASRREVGGSSCLLTVSAARARHARAPRRGRTPLAVPRRGSAGRLRRPARPGRRPSTCEQATGRPFRTARSRRARSRGGREPPGRRVETVLPTPARAPWRGSEERVREDSGARPAHLDGHVARFGEPAAPVAQRRRLGAHRATRPRPRRQVPSRTPARRRPRPRAPCRPR